MLNTHILVLYVLHHFTGDVIISGDIILTIDSEASPQFTLTCISTGGPATTVTWTRDSVTVTGGTETVLNDREEAHYTHTLTVIGSLQGLYICTVTNNKPSNDSADFIVYGMCIKIALDKLNQPSILICFIRVPLL